MENLLEDWARLIDEHLAQRPAMQVQDVYKLVYQGVRGPEHLVATPDEFVARLRAEWQAVPADDSEPLQEYIRPDKRLARVNLRAYKASGGEMDELAAACLQATRCAWGTPDDLRQTWTAWVKIGRARPAALPGDVVSTFSRWLEQHEYPAVHHSERYRELYRPAYRLVRLQQPVD